MGGVIADLAGGKFGHGFFAVGVTKGLGTPFSSFHISTRSYFDGMDWDGLSFGLVTVGLVSISEFDDLNRVTVISTLDANDNLLTRYAYTLDETGRRGALTELSGRVSTYTFSSIRVLFP